MKRKLLPKSFFFAVTIFSLSAFFFVNLNVGSTVCQAPNTSLVQTAVQEVEDQDASTLQVPDITLVGRLMEAAQRYFEH